MADDDLYDVPRSCQGAEVPPTLPPKRSNSRGSSIRAVEGLSRAPLDIRPKPMPRRTVPRISPKPCENEDVTSPQNRDASSSPNLNKSEDLAVSQSNSAMSPTTPSESESSPSGTPRPAPRPLPRRLSLKSQSDPPLSIPHFDENLPPSADEVEKMLDEMLMKEQEEAEHAGGGDTLSEKQQHETIPPSSLNHEVSKEKLPIGVLTSTTNLDEVMKDEAENDYVNSDFFKGSVASNWPAAKPSLHGHGNDDGFDSAFGGSDTFDDYAKVQKHPVATLAASDLDSFDPFRTPQPSKEKPSAGLTTVLMPTQVWAGSLEGTSSQDANSAADDEAAAPKDTDLDQSVGDRDSTQYETLWFSKRGKQDKPGMVRPQSNLMNFTPEPQADGKALPLCQPVYGERSGEYIELDPTYMVPPPPEPPPPLPSQAELKKSRPPSIPPRPPPKPAATAGKIVFQDLSHLSESATESTIPEEAPSASEGLSNPGFSPTLHSDDPFKYSGFDAECQMFNTASSGAQSADAGGSIYEIEDEPMEDFVKEWPPCTGSEAEGDNHYNVIENQPGSLSRETSESFRLSQVPPPPPRLRRVRGSEGAVSHEMTEGSRVNLYSLAHNDDLELSRSVDSSDSSEDIFMGTFGDGDSPDQRRSDLLAGAKIVPPLTPRKNEHYGYLYKQGGVKANRGWRLRFVVFNGKDLRYYDNNRSQISKKIIPLSSMKQVTSEVKETDTNRFKFKLVTTLRDRTFLFAADTRDDCCKWASTLMAAILNKDGQPADETESEKPDKEGFIFFENNKKKFYVAIWGKTLCYYDSFEDFQMHCPVHEIDMKLSSVKDKKRNRLQLSTHYAHFSLMFDSQHEAQSWRMAIEDAIAEGLADDSQGKLFGFLSVLDRVYENDSNRICADCEDENPHWASINLGIVLCKKCAGVHRMFDTSITKIRSLRMDTRVWTPSLIELMKAIGNGNANLFWEHDMLPAEKLTKDALPEERKEFAQLKYQHRRYCNKHSQAHDRKLLNEALLYASTEGDLLEAMKIIFSGADLSYAGGPQHENAYQTAKRHGQRLLMELLYQNGGDCVDTSEDLANNEGRLREDVRHQGYLLKTGPVGRTFDQRWCVLEHGNLTYYLNDKSTTAKDSIDRKNILRLQDVQSDRPDYVFEISTTKGGNRVYTFAAENPSERGMWMRTLGKLISPVAVMEHVGMMDFSLASLVFMRESVSEEWRPTWLMVSWRLLNYMNKELKLDHIDLRKATQIRMQDPQSGFCPLSLEKGPCFVLNCPRQTFYIQANLLRDTKCIFDSVSAAMKQSGMSLLDQQLSADNVPVIVDRCLKQLDSRGQQEEGIYRKAATHSKVDKLIQELKADAYAVRLDTQDIHEVANALKRFLRELDDSLFMRERYNEWIRTSMIDDHQNKFLWYRYLLEKLPLVNYSTLRRIILHISKLAEHEAQNKMNIMGLCTCFAPTLMRTENDAARGNNPGNEIKVMLDLVSQRDYLFQIEQQELDQEDIIKKAADKIRKAQEDVQRQSSQSSNFLMPISMHSCSGPCEMVNTTGSSSAQDVVQYLTRKCSLTGHNYALFEILFKGALTRPLFPTDNIMMTTGRWGDWDETVRKETCLCVTDTDILDKLDRYHEPSKALFGELKYADSKSKSKFKKTTVEFKQCVLTFYKDSRARNQLCSWKVEELSIYLGIDPKRSPPSNYGFTFVVNSKDDRSKNSCFGHCVSLGSEEEMYRWVAALLVAQNPEGLTVWNAPARS